MSDILKVAGIQTSLEWENKEKNLRNFENQISKIPSDIDIVILPEMFSTGFTMNPKSVAEKMDGKTIEWMKTIASQKNVAILASLVIEEEKQFFNRCVFVRHNGQIETYDKRHAFTLAGEHKEYASGNKKLIIEYKGWKICPLICYDLRFPVWSRNVESYDLLIFMANWPKPRIYAWDTLLKARAIENMSYVVGVNRIGEDENDYVYSGHSAIINFYGDVLNSLRENEEGIISYTLIKSEQEKVKEKLNFLNDKDSFTINY